MILILTRNDLRPEFQHLPGHEITLEHAHLSLSSSVARSMSCFAGNVVFLNEDDTIDVLKSGRRVHKFRTVLHFVASLVHRHVPLLTMEEYREIAEGGRRQREGRGFDLGT